MSLRFCCLKGHEWQADADASGQTPMCPVCRAPGHAACADKGGLPSGSSSALPGAPRQGADENGTEVQACQPQEDRPNAQTWPVIAGYEILGQLGRGAITGIPGASGNLADRRRTCREERR